MAIPKSQEMMLPLMRFASDHKEHLRGDAYDYVAQIFDVSEEERKELFPSGQDKIFSNRVQWAIVYLKKSETSRIPAQGIFQNNGSWIGSSAEGAACNRFSVFEAVSRVRRFLDGKA